MSEERSRVRAFEGTRGRTVPVLAGQKRLALLREAVITAGERGQAVLRAACDDALAGIALASGSLCIEAPLCDALVELMFNLPVDIHLVESGR